MNRKSAAILGAVAVVVLLAGTGAYFSLTSDSSDGDRDALAVVPASATEVRYVATGRILADLDLADVAPEEVVAQVGDPMALPPSNVAEHVGSMADAPLHPWQAAWEVGFAEDGGPGTVWKLDADVDLDATIAELTEAGWTSTEIDGGVRLNRTDGLAVDPEAALPLPQFTALVVYPGEQLVAFAGSPAPLDSVIAVHDGEDSFADTEAAGLLTGAPVAQVVVGDAVTCGSAGARASPEVEARGDADLPDGLGSPEAYAVSAAEDGDRARLLFTDADAAAADAPARAELLSDGTSPLTGEPFAEMIPDAEVTHDDDLVEVTFPKPFEQSPWGSLQFGTRRDGPVVCAG